MSACPTGTDEPPAARWRALATVLPVFALTRLTIFFAATSAIDSQLYYQYCVAARTASVGDLFRAYDVEYPQLAVLFAVGVGHVADALPAGAERLIAMRPNKPADIGTARFQVALGLVLAALDVTALALISRLAHKLNPSDARTQTWRLGLYVAGTAALGPILYDRLDLVVGVVALVGVAALADGRSVSAYALLTVGAGFKLVPAVLLPVFVLCAAARRERFWRALAREGTVALLVVALWPALAYLLGGGDRSFVYLKYHAERGTELGSIYAAPLLVLWNEGVGHAFGGHVVLGPAADATARAAQVATLAALALTVLGAGRVLRRSAPADRVPVLAASCMLVWLAFILTNKVGSPQYLLWVAPLVPLLPLRTRSERIAAVGFVAAGVLATLTYPYLWPAVHGAPVPDRPGTWSGPTALGFALLLARWSALAVPTAWLAVRLWNLGRAHPNPDRAYP